jgi:hypothetical protein
MFGVILTHTKSLNEFRQYVRKYKLDTIKVVTGWGLPDRWSTNNRAQLLAMTQNTVIRTVSGDPSFGGNISGDFTYPDGKRCIAELEPWLSIKPDALVEIGNEPNLPHVDRWIYLYHLQETLKSLQQRFPLATFISPGLIQNELEGTWYTTRLDVWNQFDYTGVHLYEHETFINSERTKRTLTIAPKQEIFITECGINKVNPNRVIEYTQLTRARSRAGVTWYHYNDKKDIDPQYHI